MTTKELSKSIIELDDPQKFDDITLTLNIDGGKKIIKGLATMYEFTNTQKKNWSRIEDIPDMISPHKEFYNNLLDIIIFFYTKEKENRKEEIEKEWSNCKGHNNGRTFWVDKYYNIDIHSSYFTYNHPAVIFISDISKKLSPRIAFNTYKLIKEDTDGTKERAQFVASILAYEFFYKDSDITTRRKHERLSLDKLRSDLSKSLDGSKESLNEFYSDSKAKIEEFATTINETKEENSKKFDVWLQDSTNKLNSSTERHLNKVNEAYKTKFIEHAKGINNRIEGKFNEFDYWDNEKKKEYDDWYNTTKETLSELCSSSERKIKDLEETYQQKLRLQKPAEYWKKRANEMRERGNNARKWLIGLIVFSAIALITYIVIAPKRIIPNVIDGDSDAMKWLLVSITIISFLAYGIRSLNKLMFSAYHLARDAEEREQLTHVYLALHNDNKVDESERSIVLQALFSRADTGLLKEDSSPTMPSIIIEKFAKS